MREMAIDSIRVSLTNYQRVVILKDNDSDRYLPIWIGATEADAIALKLQDVNVPRPLTHDLLETVIESLGAQVNHILVSDLSDDTFYAKIILQQDGGDRREIDSRPSDAIALAVRTGAPIYAEDEVIDKAGVHLDKESGKAVIPSDDEEERPPTEEELKRLSAFSDFVASLDLEGLGEGGDDGGDKPPAAGAAR